MEKRQPWKLGGLAMNNEPVAWMTQVVGGNKNKWDLVFNKPIPHDLYNSIPLYTHPAKTLTDEAIITVADPLNLWDVPKDKLIEFARAILRKAQEK